MDRELIAPFVRGTEQVIQMMAFTPVEAGECLEKLDDAAFGIVSGIMGLASDKLQGGFVISFEEPSLLAIVSSMLGAEYKQINEEVIDAVGEITNMVTGFAKREFENQGIHFEMALPVVVSGQTTLGSQLYRGRALCVPFRAAAGAFFIEVSLCPRQSKNRS